MNIIVFDIGGTNIKWGMFVNNELKEKGMFPTRANELEGKQIIEAVAKFVIDKFPKADGVGIATPGVVSSDFTIVGASPNIKNYNGVNLASIFKNSGLTIPIHVENDANTAIMGEIANGALKDHKTESSVMITLGTGIGGANVYHGKLEKGSNGWAGEYGHYFAEGDIMEKRYSTSGLIRLLKAATGEELGGEEIWHRLNEPKIQAVLDTWLDGLAFGIHHILISHDPKNLVIGGGASENPEFSLPNLKKLLLKTTPSVIVDNLNLVKAQLGNDAALWGALYLWNQHNI